MKLFVRLVLLSLTNTLATPDLSWDCYGSDLCRLKPWGCLENINTIYSHDNTCLLVEHLGKFAI